MMFFQSMPADLGSSSGLPGRELGCAGDKVGIDDVLDSTVDQGTDTPLSKVINSTFMFYKTLFSAGGASPY